MDPNGPRPPIAPERLDLLVDGSLSVAERRALLLRISTEPDGWRRCALAFLEAQAWREAAGSMTAAEPRPEAPGDRPGPPRSRHRLRLAPIALAAGLTLTAFVLGRVTGEALRPGSAGPVGGPALVVGPNPSTPLDLPSPPDPGGSTGPITPGPGPGPSPYQAVGYLNLATSDDPDSPVFQLPVLAGPGIDDHWLRDQPSFVPEEVRRSWEERGYDVALQRRLVSVQLDDSGRYLTIPVDEVRLSEAGRATY